MPKPVLLSRAAFCRRVGIFGLVFALTALGSIALTDPWWPIGPQKQYATGIDVNGTIHSTYAVARNAAGHTVTVPWGISGIGIGRAEIEGQLQRFIDHPALLQALAVGHARNMPHDSPYTSISLMQQRTKLKDAVDQKTTVVRLARWHVRDPGHPARAGQWHAGAVAHRTSAARTDHRASAGQARHEP